MVFKNSLGGSLSVRSSFCTVVAALVLFGVSLPAFAEIVPIPRIKPLTTASQQAAAVPIGAPAQPTAPRSSAVSASSDEAILVNISNYFNSFRTMQGDFIQIGPRGEQSEGTFHIARPGKIRFQYKPPVRLDVISDGRSVAIQDTRAKTQEMYPYSKTPLRFLLDNHVDLTSRSLVDDVRQESDLISVVISEKSRVVEGKLTLIFDRQTYELRQWVVTDAQGLDTSVAVFNTRTGINPDPGLFRIYLMR